jgi:phage baseplate assembly protein W
MARTLTLPLRVTGARMASIEQGHPAEIAQSLGLLLATRPGERRSSPDYGYPDPTFVGVNPDLLRAVADEWEPRADLDDVEIAATTYDGSPGQAVTIQLAADEDATTTVQEA